MSISTQICRCSPRAQPNSAHVWRNSSHVGPNFPDSGTTLAEVGRNCPHFGRIRPKYGSSTCKDFAEIRASSVETGPIPRPLASNPKLSGAGRSRPQLGPNLTKFCVYLCPNLIGSGQIWPMTVELAAISVVFGPKSTAIVPSSGKSAPDTIWAMSTGFGPIWASTGMYAEFAWPPFRNVN